MTKEEQAKDYFERMNNVSRTCPMCKKPGVLEYMTSEVREGERCPECTYWTFGRK